MKSHVKSRLFAAVSLLVLIVPALAQDPGPEAVQKANALIEQARNHMDARNPQKALQLLGQALPLNPRDPTVPYLMAVCEFNIGVGEDDLDRLDRARQLLDEAIDLDPQWGEPFFFLGVMSFQRKDYRTAIYGFETSLNRGYRVKDAHVNRAQALFMWGVELAEDPQQERDPVVNIFRKAVDAFEFLKDDLRFSTEDRQRFHRFWIDSMINLASVDLLAMNMPEAEALERKLISLEPERYLHYYNLGLVLGREEKGWEEALDAYRKALELNSDKGWLEPLPRIGYIRSQQAYGEADPEKRAKKKAEAESYFLRYLEKYPNSVDPLMRLGEHYKKFGELDRAIETFRRGITVDPLTINLMNMLGEALVKAGETEAGERWITLYTELSRLDREGTLYHDRTRGK